MLFTSFSLLTPGATLQTVNPNSIQYQESVAGFLYQILAGTIFLHLDEVAAGPFTLDSGG